VISSNETSACSPNRETSAWSISANIEQRASLSTRSLVCRTTTLIFLFRTFDSAFHIPVCLLLLHSATTRSRIYLPRPEDGPRATHALLLPKFRNGSALKPSELRNSEYSAVADNLDWRTTRLWTLFLCDLPTSFPGRAFEYLRESELFLRQVEFGSYLLRDSVPGGGGGRMGGEGCFSES
jgi:hypothetical protein